MRIFVFKTRIINPYRAFQSLMAIIVILSLFYSRADALFLSSQLDARLLAVGSEQVVFGDDIVSSYYNPALVQLDGSQEISASYNNPYGIESLHRSSISFNFPGRGIALHINSLNYKSDYYEMESCAVYSRDAGQDWRLGMGLSFYYVSVPGYRDDPSFLSSDMAIGIHAGVFKKIEKMDFGISLRNINTPDFRLSENTADDSVLPLSVALGVAYRPLEGIWIGSTGVFKDGCFLPSAGIEVMVASILALRMGVDKNFLNFGSGLDFGSISFDVGLTSHEYLGLNYLVSFGYEF